MRLAARGARETAAGEAPVADAWLVGQLKRQARDVHVQSLLAAAALTGALLLVPSTAR